MKHLLTILFAIVASLPISAQTFMDHIRNGNTQQATMTVTQSKQIDSLVNNTKKNVATKRMVTPKTVATERPATTKTLEQPQHEKTVKENTHKESHEAQQKETHKPDSAATHKKETPHSEKNEPRAERNASRTSKGDTDGMDIPTVDMRKKVMRGGYKVTGYRVQVFSGGNSRADRQKAQKAGNDVKMRFPNQPVYVHFYSPRWICRVGNYRSLQQAQWMLKEVKKMGYTSAIIVKGKITVQ